MARSYTNGEWILNNKEVDLETWLLSDAGDQTFYNSLIERDVSPRWTDQLSLEYTLKTNHPGIYDQELDEFDGEGIHEAPNGAPEDDDLRATRLEGTEEASLQELSPLGERLAEEENDWRVRLHLGSKADYLYRDQKQMAEGSILAPLVATDGIIFPYTPEIAIQYNADYSNYDLVHSNYRGYFYKGSQVQNILLTATFTANDIAEANYLLASLHFLRSCTKMFYGNDIKRGMPPPVVFLTGLGEYQFKDHPCAITQVNYNMPNDVDYIACGKVGNQTPISYPQSVTGAREARLQGASITAGAETPQASQNSANKPDNNDGPVIYGKSTYVPTKIDINFTMIPIQTREQVSKGFSLEKYASGSLLKKGYW